MFRITTKGSFFIFVLLMIFVSMANSQMTVYNNFGPGHNGWDYNYSTGWTVAGVNVPAQYGVEQAMGFQSTGTGTVTDIWVAFFYVPMSTLPDTVTIRLTRNPAGLPPDTTNIMEEWTITNFQSWSQWNTPQHLQGNGNSILQESESYWLWAIGAETTWCGWCMNINSSLTCPHTLRREGEGWLPIANETASAFRVDVIPPQAISPSNIGTIQDYTLAQNYPNPFNSTTLIIYEIPRQSHVTIDIYNSLGRKVTTLTKGLLPSGSHQVTWNAEDATSGVYFYKIQTDTYTETKKMILLK